MYSSGLEFMIRRVSDDRSADKQNTENFKEKTMRRIHLWIFFALLLFFALLAFLTFALGLQHQLIPEGETLSQLSSMPDWLLGVANAAIVFIFYSVFGLVGLAICRRLGLPGIFRNQAGWNRWVWVPMLLGIVTGIVITVLDRLFALAEGWNGFEHPPFPFSLIASASAAIGEEILFRGFVLVLWAMLLNLILKKWNARNAALWIGNIIAALIFAASHIPAVMILIGADTPAAIPPLVFVELFLLNGLVGIVAGERFIRDGLVAAVGVHFWVDIVWHVIWPLLAG
jgi:membrane protease YdiL (CAAX protease family)